MIANLSLAQPPIKSHLISKSANLHTLVIEPLMPGYGHTLGNSIRRVLLSSIPGSAVTRIRINEITHEYQSIPGVVEDALDVILNLKLVRCKILSDDEKIIINLTKNKEGKVMASDFGGNNKVEIVNPDLYICYLNSDSKLEIELEISRGVGYLSVEEINLAENTNPQDMYVDAVFSPVVNVSLNVEQVRVGEKTNFDKLEISFETDLSIDPREVVEFVIKNLMDLLARTLSSFQSSISDQSVQLSSVASTPAKTSALDKSDNINLPTRIKNILEKNNITTNKDLVTRIGEVESFAGITEKSFSTIEDYIKTIS